MRTAFYYSTCKWYSKCTLLSVTLLFRDVIFKTQIYMERCEGTILSFLNVQTDFSRVQQVTAISGWPAINC